MGSGTLTKVSLSRRYFAATSRATFPEVAFGSKLAFPAAYTSAMTINWENLEEWADAVMVARGESFKVIVSLNSSRVFTLSVSDSSSIFSQFSLHNIISNISTEEESLMSGNSVSGESRSLKQIEESTGMESLLSVMKTDLSVL
jgi:hypothetical protein